MIKIHQSTDSQFYFTVCGKNGTPITTSETYTRKSDAKRAARNMLATLGAGKKIQLVDKTT